MFPLKRISPSGVPAALQKAERYRLLNDSSAAESICRDIVEVDLGDSVRRAREVLPRLRDEYKRAYYAGIICERRAKAQRRQAKPGSGAMAYESFREAMDWYEKAEAMSPAGNDEAILRWNTCARVLDSDDHLRPLPIEQYEPVLED
jgi:hypothetical protein